MKIRKLLSKITAAALAACLCCTCTPLTNELAIEASISANAASSELSGTCGENVTWFLDESTGVLTISGTGDMTDYTKNTSLFFNDTRINEIIIEDGITSIGDYAFYNCTTFYKITIPNSVTSIGNQTFSNCVHLESINIPESVTSIGDSAFDYCKSLPSIEIPDSVTSIGERAFWKCESLESIIILGNVTSIKNQTFYGCKSLKEIKLPNSVTSIEKEAFRDCYNLISITIPDSVTSIGDSAFYWCQNLTSITIPDSVTSIEYDAFYRCICLTEVHINNIKAWCKIDFKYAISNPLFYANRLYLNDKLITDLVIPDDVTSIKDYSFIHCTSLTSITIPDSVTSIGADAFNGCTSLTSITIPDSVTSISVVGYNGLRGGAFSGCTSLTSIIIPDSVTSIGRMAFYGCSNLSSITIPDSVTSIEVLAFYECDSLTDVYYAGSEDNWNKIKIDGYNDALKNATIHFNSTGPSFVPETYSACFPKPYKIIALKSNVNGKYLGCDVGAKQSNGKYNMNDSVIKAEADKIQAYEEFELVPCFGGSYYALRSRFNRKYLSYEGMNYEANFISYEGPKFKADFIKDYELLELDRDGTGCRIRFVNEDKYLCVGNDNKVGVTDDSAAGTWFQLETVSENNYTTEEKNALASDQWFNLDNKGVGYWNIQNEIGQEKSDLTSLRNTDSMYVLGYTMLGRKDRFASTIEYDNMQCAIGAKKLSDGTYDVLIVFQGTDGYSNEDVFNFFRDIGSNLTSGINGYGMHNGYAKMAEKLADHESDIVVNPYLDAINKIDSDYTLSDFLNMAKDGKARITLLGHSMGGAIAQCYALHLAYERKINRKNIIGRTFNSALAVANDEATPWPDWINLCVSSDTVCNGLVTGSIYEYGVHRLGRTIWLYDPEPDINNDENFPKSNIADPKHCMDQALYNLLSGITKNNSAYYNELIGGLRKTRTTESNLFRPVYLEISKDDKVMVSNFKDMMLSVTDGFIQKIDESIKAVIENDKLYIELPADEAYTVEVTPADNSPSVVAVSDNTSKYGTSSISVYEVSESNGTFTVNIPANNGSSTLTDTSGEAVEPVKNWILGDVNDDGSLTVADVVILQKWLLAVPYTEFSDWTAADVCRDNRLNVFDLCLIKRLLINQ